MIESWLVVSSDDESCDSDKIDSDIEAELYSVIHHEASTATSLVDPHLNQSSQSSISAPLEENVVVLNEDPFISELSTINNLHTSFETPERRISQSSSLFNEVKRDSVDNNSKGQKRKSDLIDDVLQDIQLNSSSEIILDNSDRLNTTSPKRQKRVNSSKNSDPLPSINRTVEIDTSDSDSVIWTKDDECDLKLQTNLAPDTITLSSDSFSDRSLSPFTQLCSSSFNNSINTSQSSLSFNENSNDPWHINAEDLYRSRKRTSRYHEKAVLNCSNCNLRGHSAKFCSVPKAVKCYICGGGHMGHNCKARLCHKCLRVGHDSRFCYHHMVDICFHCTMKGHTVKHCPDLWRRYHLTTTQRKIVAGRQVVQDSPIYCFTCGKQGHYGAECQGPRSDRFCFPTWTTVITYSHPSETISKAREVHRNTALSGTIPQWPARQSALEGPPVWAPINSFSHHPAQNQVPLNTFRQHLAQNQIPLNTFRQHLAQNQVPLNTFWPPPAQNQVPIEKRKKIKNGKKGKGKSPLQTQEHTKCNQKKEVGFPRTPKASPKQAEQPYKRGITPQQLFNRKQRKIMKKQRKLRRRLGLPALPTPSGKSTTIVLPNENEKKSKEKSTLNTPVSIKTPETATPTTRKLTPKQRLRNKKKEITYQMKKEANRNGLLRRLGLPTLPMNPTMNHDSFS